MYYYDLAGNLVKTIPPEGTKFITSTTDLTQIVNHRYDPVTYDDTVYTAHKLETRYWYNSLNQPRKQYTPDGDTTRFWYDVVGRLAVSQSARQRPDTFSYTLYDALGRITQVGKLAQTTDMTQAISQSPSSLSGWISGATNRGEVTRTFYDAAVFSVPGLTQENLRSRVSSTTYADAYSATLTSYDVATHYSYDIAGNVKTLVDDIKSLNSYKERYKRIDYEYDLVSGNVNRVNYQADSADQFFYRYSYDADNRITEALTSRDGYIWDRDANYFYYDHGPLARTEIGERQVQGMDYAYSIQGWLKGINELHLLETHDMGQDGVSGAMQHKRLPKDIFGMTLNYFAGDYSQVTKQFKWEPAYATSSFNSASKDLYNGNIRSIGITIDKLSPKTAGYSYGYDQLNRLVSMDVYNSFTGSTYSWPSSTSPMKDWRERVTYDANGNILTYNRHGEGTTWKMDSLIYYYSSGTNRLNYVDDKVASGNYAEDIDDQASGNYTYDASGNLKSDTKEGITDIQWNTYGKVKKITKSGGTTITFSYDPAGNRIYKKVTSTGQPATSTYYIRDAQGNILSTYTLKDDTVRWNEQMMYGSARLGLVNMNHITAPLNFTMQTTDTLQYFEGLKNYELTNHLGNVQVVLSDKKIGIDDNSNTFNDEWITEQISGQDYYPFGMLMPERSFSYENYGFGFNNQEKDDEIKGEGNILDFGERMYDPRLSRFFSVDGLTSHYPWYSPYQFAGNKPIWAIDLDGLEEYIKTYHFENGKATLLGVQKNSEVEIEMLSISEKNGQTPFKRNIIDTRTGKPMDPSEIGQVQYQYFDKDGNKLNITRNFDGDYVEGSNDIMPLGEDNLFGSIYIGPNNPEVIVNGRPRADYRREPQDEVDAAALIHDKAYDKLGAAGLGGALSDKTIAADLDLIIAADNVRNKASSDGIDSVTSKPVSSSTTSRAKWVTRFFKTMVTGKILN